MRRAIAICAAAICALLAGGAAAKCIGTEYCCSVETCQPFCKINGTHGTANAAAVAAKGWHAPAHLGSVADVVKALGCTRANSAAKCGIVYSGQQFLSTLVTPMAEAVKKLRAANPKYVLEVQSGFRSVVDDTSRICDRIAKGQSEGSRLCGYGLVCPGPNSHSDGFALDIVLRHLDKLNTRSHGYLTEPVGMWRSCKKNFAALQKEKDGHAKKLNKVMFSLGFYRYCQEPWHFELSAKPLNSLRTNCVDDADCKGGKTCKPTKVADNADAHDEVMVCK